MAAADEGGPGRSQSGMLCLLVNAAAAGGLNLRGMTNEVRGMMKYDDDVKRRLKRIEGQVRGVLNMMEDEKPCKDVVSQLTAIRNATDKAIAYIVAKNLGQCIVEQQASGEASDRLIQEAVELLIKSR